MRTNKHGYNRKYLDFFFTILRLRMDRRSIFNALLLLLLLWLFAAVVIVVVSLFVRFFLYLSVYVFMCVGRCCYVCLLLTQTTKWPINLIERDTHTQQRMPRMSVFHKSNTQHMWHKMKWIMILMTTYLWPWSCLACNLYSNRLRLLACHWRMHAEDI